MASSIATAAAATTPMRRRRSQQQLLPPLSPTAAPRFSPLPRESTTSTASTSHDQNANDSNQAEAPPTAAAEEEEEAGQSPSCAPQESPLSTTTTTTTTIQTKSKSKKKKTAKAKKEEVSRAEDESTPAVLPPPVAPPSSLSLVYKVICKHHGLAYGTPNSPIYGENNKSSMTRAFQAMQLEGEGVVFCDVGSGTGAPSLHAACEYPHLVSYGFELMGSRWWISQTILSEVLANAATQHVGERVMLAHVDLADLGDFGPCTHVFAFDTGFPKQAIQLFAKAVNASKHIRVLGSFHKPAVMAEAGFKDLTLHCKVKMTMSGSSEGKQLLVYHRTAAKMAKTTTTATTTTTTTAPSWDITGQCGVPKQSECQPTVPHAPSYARGEEERLRGLAPYRAWVRDQIGFDRKGGERGGVTTRSQARRAAAVASHVA